MTGAMGSRLSPAAEVRSSVGAMQVTPANVLQIRNALLAESQLLSDKVAVATGRATVGKPGQDPVSETASDGFNQKIKALMDQCHGYVNALTEAAASLEQTAKSYGHTEQQINESFIKFQTDHPAPTSMPTSPPTPGPPLLSFARTVAGLAPSRATPVPGDLRSLFPGAGGGSS
jgi:uncharacterized protein YukE